MPSLYGDRGVVRRAHDALRLAGIEGNAARALTELDALLDRLRLAAPAARLVVDLGELRGFDYSTGVRFAAFADGAGDAIAWGGRYDELCGRDGRAVGATGFAVDVEAVSDACAKQSPERPSGILVAGPASRALPLVATLRASGNRAACDPCDRDETLIRREGAICGVAWRRCAPRVRKYAPVLAPCLLASGPFSTARAISDDRLTDGLGTSARASPTRPTSATLASSG